MPEKVYEDCSKVRILRSFDLFLASEGTRLERASFSTIDMLKQMIVNDQGAIVIMFVPKDLDDETVIFQTYPYDTHITVKFADE